MGVEVVIFLVENIFFMLLVSGGYKWKNVNEWSPSKAGNPAWDVTDYTLPGQEYFCLRKVYTFWPVIQEGFTIPVQEYSAFAGFFPEQERVDSRKS